MHPDGGRALYQYYYYSYFVYLLWLRAFCYHCHLLKSHVRREPTTPAGRGEGRELSRCVLYVT